jgi:hypothetical protein
MSDLKTTYLQTPAWANPPRVGYGDRLLDCDKTLLNEETRRQQDLFQAGERDPGLMPKPKGFFEKAFQGARAATCGVLKGADYLPKLPALGHDSNGNFSVSSGNTTFRSDGHFGVQAPGSKMRFNSDGSFTYNGYNSDGSWNSR